MRRKLCGENETSVLLACVLGSALYKAVLHSLGVGGVVMAWAELVAGVHKSSLNESQRQGRKQCSISWGVGPYVQIEMCVV